MADLAARRFGHQLEKLAATHMNQCLVIGMTDQRTIRASEPGRALSSGTQKIYKLDQISWIDKFFMSSKPGSSGPRMVDLRLMTIAFRH